MSRPKLQAAPFQMPRPLSVAVTSTIHAVKDAAIVMFEDTETTEAAWMAAAR